MKLTASIGLADLISLNQSAAYFFYFQKVYDRLFLYLKSHTFDFERILMGFTIGKVLFFRKTCTAFAQAECYLRDCSKLFRNWKTGQSYFRTG